jgi:hypothetical protein
MTKEIKLSNGMVALVDDEDYESLSRWKWCAHKSKGNYYAERGTRNRRLGTQKTIRMNRQIMNAPDGVQVDHKNRNTLDNQKHNLRLCNNSQNQCNKIATKKNKSGYKGVYKRASESGWCASIQVNKKRFFLGLFDNLIDAARAYDQAAKIYHGEFAKLNLE